jgi:hypothetical protein
MTKAESNLQFYENEDVYLNCQVSETVCEEVLLEIT